MIYLTGEINSEMTLGVLKRLDKNPKRANFMLCSMGGSLADGLAIYDRIRRLPKSIITATGVCASAAVVVLQAAKIRRATPETQFLFHLVEFNDAKDNHDFKPHYDLATFDIFRRRISNDAYKSALKKKIFNARYALDLGLIDEIWEGQVDKSGIS